jgi:hypothetical protein
MVAAEEGGPGRRVSQIRPHRGQRNLIAAETDYSETRTIDKNGGPDDDFPESRDSVVVLRLFESCPKANMPADFVRQRTTIAKHRGIAIVPRSNPPKIRIHDSKR